jgi:hypothetical protein
MAGTWYPLTNAPPALPSGDSFYADSMLLLTDGSVLVHHAGKTWSGGTEWLRLCPDVRGSYRNGTWKPTGAMKHTRQFFASGVRADGKVFVIGGEYSDAGDDTPLGEIFDCATGHWSDLQKPAEFDWICGDAACCTLADGRILLGAIHDARTALWDPTTNSWTAAGTAHGTKANTKAGQTGEETWTLLSDGAVLAVETYPTAARVAEKYLPKSDTWVSAGKTPAQLVDTDMHEIGPAILLPDGRVFAIGGTGHTALYTPVRGAPEKPGSWAKGHDLKNSAGGLLSVNDGPACLLPNGKVLCCAGTRDTETNNGNVEHWSVDPLFFEYDSKTNLATQTVSQPNPALPSTWQTKFLLLPSGEVLCTAEQNQVFIYQPYPGTNDAWRPTIKAAPQALVCGATYALEGTQLNGLSHAVSYGDDYTAATNYPLVRLEGGDAATPIAHYCETSEFGYGVATGTASVSTKFRVPVDVVPEAYRLYVVANGIPSKPHSVTVAAGSVV